VATTDALARPRTDLMGLGIDRLSEDETIDEALGALQRQEGGWICPTNLDVLRQYVTSDDVRELVDEADLVVADGMPLIWASRLAGAELPGRVAGSSLIWSLPERAAQDGASVFLLGGNEGAADDAADILRERHPDLSVAGTMCPPFGFDRDDDQLDAIDARLREARPDVVFVGLGFPKQEKLIRRLRKVLPEAWFVSVGISFSFVSGEVRRAPTWVQRVGLEWLHRLFQEPERLFRRYVVDGLPFMVRLLANAGRSRVRRLQRAAG
jgi:N-acetylglucosaminyldiphosphoundecaprenol N-acetyl-beta-D-mannosaminyltransferase